MIRNLNMIPAAWDLSVILRAKSQMQSSDKALRYCIACHIGGLLAQTLRPEMAQEF